MPEDGFAPVPARPSAFVACKRFSNYFRAVLNRLDNENSKSEADKIRTRFKGGNAGHGAFKT